MTDSAVFCEHANEVPASPWCHCPSTCYCWQNTCKGKRDRYDWGRRGPTDAAVRETKGAVTCTDFTDRVDLLRWAASRPGVIRLLEALRVANYDETAAEHLRRVVERDPDVGRRNGPSIPIENVVPEIGIEQTKDGKCANCGKDWSFGKHVARGTGYCEVDC